MLLYTNEKNTNIARIFVLNERRLMEKDIIDYIGIFAPVAFSFILGVFTIYEVVFQPKRKNLARHYIGMI